SAIHGLENVGIFRTKGQPNLEIPIDPQKCSLWGVSVADVEDVIQTAVGGKPVSKMIEGEKRFDITLRWPEELRGSEEAILNIPVDLSNNDTSDENSSGSQKDSDSGSAGLATGGANMPKPSLAGSKLGGASNILDAAPRRR